MIGELHLGETNVECAGCRLAFDSNNRSVASVRVASQRLPILFFEYRICGKCATSLKTQGPDHDVVLAGINAYFEGQEAKA